MAGQQLGGLPEQHFAGDVRRRHAAGRDHELNRSGGNNDGIGHIAGKRKRRRIQVRREVRAPPQPPFDLNKVYLRQVEKGSNRANGPIGAVRAALRIGLIFRHFKATPR